MVVLNPEGRFLSYTSNSFRRYNALLTLNRRYNYNTYICFDGILCNLIYQHFFSLYFFLSAHLTANATETVNTTTLPPPVPNTTLSVNTMTTLSIFLKTTTTKRSNETPSTTTRTPDVQTKMINGTNFNAHTSSKYSILIGQELWARGNQYWPIMALFIEKLDLHSNMTS